MAKVFTVYKMSESSEIASEGFDIRNVSGDGLMAIVDKNSESEPTVTSAPVKPSYIVESMLNWPHLSPTEAKKLASYLEWATVVAFSFTITKDSSTTLSVTNTMGNKLTWSDGTDSYEGDSVTFANWDDSTEKTVTVRCRFPELITGIHGSQWNNINLTTVDISKLTGISGEIDFRENSGLTSIINPTASGIITAYYVHLCALTSLDLSGLTGLSGNLYFLSNSGLTTVDLPSTSGTFTKVWGYGCDLGYIDFTVMPNMTDINNCDIRLHNNNMIDSEVNQIVDDIDSDAVTGSYTGRAVQLHGTNAAPTSGPPDGEAAVTSMTGKNFSMTVSA